MFLGLVVNTQYSPIPHPNQYLIIHTIDRSDTITKVEHLLLKTQILDIINCNSPILPPYQKFRVSATYRTDIATSLHISHGSLDFFVCPDVDQTIFRTSETFYATESATPGADVLWRLLKLAVISRLVLQGLWIPKHHILTRN